MVFEVPHTALSLMKNVYKKVFPAVAKELSYWKDFAQTIPNDELRTQALASISSKRFHCQGGGVYALLAGERWQEAIRFIVAYQTIRDYLDNLCDRSTSMDPNDFRLLHQAMIDAISPDATPINYYQLREDQMDGDYLINLVQTCQNTLKQIENHPNIKQYLLQLVELYSDLQVHKHVSVEDRIPRLTSWYEQNKGDFSSLEWFEFSAAAGSTLGVFCVVSYALGNQLTDRLVGNIIESYFPYVQGLHILLDYYIDQEEDREEEDLNFCYYYRNKEEMKERFIYFIDQASKHVQHLPNSPFHEMIIKGLIGLYLGDDKVKLLDKSVWKELLQYSGIKTRFFYWNTRLYFKMSKSI